MSSNMRTWSPNEEIGFSGTFWDYLGRVLAERVGFEPTIRLRVFRFSRPARSTAPSPLRLGGFYQRGGSTRRFDGLESAHVGLQGRRDVHAAIGALIVLHDRNQRPAYREPRPVQGVHQLWLALLVAEARLHAPRLERLAVAARGNLPVGVLARQPDFEVVGLRCLEPHVARAKGHDAVRDLQTLQDLFGVRGEALQRLVRFVRMHDVHQLDLVELVVSDHAAGVLAVGAGFAAEAGRMADELERELIEGHD